MNEQIQADLTAVRAAIDNLKASGEQLFADEIKALEKKAADLEGLLKAATDHAADDIQHVETEVKSFWQTLDPWQRVANTVMPIPTKWLPYIGGLLFLVLLAGGCWYGGYRYAKAHMEPPPIVYLPVDQAETGTGIQQAMNAANTPVSKQDANYIADQVRQLETQAAESIVQTTVANLATTVENQKEKAGADVALLTPRPIDKTDIKVPDKPQTTQIPANLPANTPVELNQYNIHLDNAHWGAGVAVIGSHVAVGPTYYNRGLILAGGKEVTAEHGNFIFLSKTWRIGG